MRKPSLALEIVRKKIASLFPRVSTFEPISSGEESQTFRFVSEDRKFILRLNSNREPFEKDRFVYERFATPKLPIPRVVLIGQLQHHYYCVSQQLPGTTLQDVDPEDISSLLSPTREVLHAIAQSDLAGINGYGPFDSQGITTLSSWRDFLLAILDTARPQREKLRPYADLSLIDQWLHMFHLLALSCPEERALVHGDFGSNNVLADAEKITGVLDWSEAMIGDPLYDVANIFFWRTWLPCMEQQARYFEAHPWNLPDWEQRILCYQLRIGLSEVFGNLLEPRGKSLIWALDRCEQIIRAIKTQTAR